MRHDTQLTGLEWSIVNALDACGPDSPTPRLLDQLLDQGIEIDVRQLNLYLGRLRDKGVVGTIPEVTTGRPGRRSRPFKHSLLVPRRELMLRAQQQFLLTVGATTDDDLRLLQESLPRSLNGSSGET